MALASSVKGDGDQISYEADVVRWYVMSATGVRVDYIKTVAREVLRWYSLTQAAAESWVDSAPAGERRRSSQSVREVGAYDVESETETVTIVTSTTTTTTGA